MFLSSVHIFFLCLIASIVLGLPQATPCPSSASEPIDEIAQLHPNFDGDKCITVDGPWENGTPVVIWDCTGASNQDWKLSFGNTKIQLANTNLCLDAGSDNPADGTRLKIWKCYDNLAAQAWHYTNDFRIALTDRGKCVDLKRGGKNNGNIIQTWTCRDDNANQVWAT